MGAARRLSADGLHAIDARRITKDAATNGIGPRRPRLGIGVDLARSQSSHVFILLFPAT